MKRNGSYMYDDTLDMQSQNFVTIIMMYHQTIEIHFDML